MSKTITLRLDDETYEEVRRRAAAEDRSISNLIETAALRQLREEDFVSDEEMTEILADLRRIRAPGHRRILEKLRTRVHAQLGPEPHLGPNIRTLRPHDPETWRYRIRDWRLFYEIDEEERIVFMTAAHHRAEAY